MDISNMNLGQSLLSVGVPTIKEGAKAQIGSAVEAAGINTNTFDSFFKAYMDLYKETDASIQAAESLQTDLALGMTDDIVAVTLAQERANASLNFTIQVTNRVIEAYREIMRMQM